MLRRPSAIAQAALALTAAGLAAAVVVLALAREDGRLPPPHPSEPAAYTVALVNEAAAYREREGREAALARYRSPSAVDGDWFVFIADAASGAILAHYAPDVVGRSLDGPFGVDATGYDFGKALLAADERGRWVSYVAARPSGGELQRKRAWAVNRDGLIFVSGWYEHAAFAAATPEAPSAAAPDAPGKETPAAYTRAFVAAALELVETRGFSHALDFYDSPGSIDGDWYLFMAQAADGVILAHAASPGHVGRSLLGPLGVDSTGDRFGPRLLAAGEEGAWVTYVHRNPRTCHWGVKHAWAVASAGIVYVSGWYEDGAPVHPLLPGKCEPEAYARATLERAIARHDAEGREAAIAFHSDPDHNDGRWYVFLVDAVAGTVLAHPAAGFIGYDFAGGDESYDDSGFHYAPPLLAATPAGVFARGVISAPTRDELNPFHRAEEVKHYFAMRRGDVVFITGWYEPAPDPATDPDGYARLLVARALTRYDDDGREAALAWYGAPEGVDGAWSAFALEDGGADGPRIVASAGPVAPVAAADLAAFGAAAKAGRWVSHRDGEGEPRRTWIVRRGDLIFGAGRAP